ncbi:MAG: N-6 DNA methylase [Lentisphaeraceae bacterium]|nr:N-6 DNA methylase [Lentisphaeraceae bacterium]
MDRVRFYPEITEAQFKNSDLVYLEDVGTVVSRLKQQKPHKHLEAQSVTIKVWLPFYAQMMELFLDGSKVLAQEDTLPSNMLITVNEEWLAEAKKLMAEYKLLLNQNRLSQRFTKKGNQFSELVSLIEKVIANKSADDRDKNYLAFVLGHYLRKYGFPDSEEFNKRYEAQSNQCKTPIYTDIARVLVERLSKFSLEEGLADIEQVLVDVDEEESKQSTIDAGVSIPECLAQKTIRCQLNTIDSLIDQKLIKSADVLAVILPQITSGVSSNKFDNEEFDVVIANPPYGVSWSGYSKDIRNDKTERFKYLPSISDGQLLFMQHLISKLDANGIGVVVHNGSSLFSGEAGSSESNIRKWMLDNDLVEALIQLPTEEFFNTNIYTYLWVLNKRKDQIKQGKVLLIDASNSATPLKKKKGEKKKELAEAAINTVVDTLNSYTDSSLSKLVNKEHFYFNKQNIMLTNVDINGLTFESQLPLKEDKKTGQMKQASSMVLAPVSLTDGERELTEFTIMKFDAGRYTSLLDYFEQNIKPFISALDYKEKPLRVSTSLLCYWYDNDQETLIKEDLKSGNKENLGCGKIIIKSVYKKETKKLPERIAISIELTPNYEKDYEIIPFNKDESINQLVISKHMNKYVGRQFKYLENTVGVEINFKKEFYRKTKLRSTKVIQTELIELNEKLAELENEFFL